MKFILMMQGTKAGFESMSAWSAADFKAHIAFMMQFNKKLTESGELVSAEGLEMPDQAKIVQARPGAALAVTDGPFPEAKEFLAGYWIVDVETPARAYAIAGEASAAPGLGGAPVNIPIEVRGIGGRPPVDM